MSIDGETNSGFYLGFFPYMMVGTNIGGRFELFRPTSDSKEATAIRAFTKHGVYTKNWYHLAGVYDAKDQSISLYLNGILQTNLSYTPPGRPRAKSPSAADCQVGAQEIICGGRFGMFASIMPL